MKEQLLKGKSLVVSFASCSMWERVADSKENVMLMPSPHQPVPRFHLRGEGEWDGASYQSLQFENSDTHGHEDQKSQVMLWPKGRWRSATRAGRTGGLKKMGWGRVKMASVRQFIHYNSSNHGACVKQAEKPRFCHARMKPKQMTWEDMQS